MPELFRSKLRIRTSPAQMGERSYAFIDSSAWQACEAFRSLANKWVSILPTSHQVEVIRDIKRGGDEVFFSRMLEILVGALIKGLGYDVNPHPDVEGTDNKPDFEILSGTPSSRVGLVEVVTIRQSKEAISSGRRNNVLFNAIDNIKMPKGSFLAYNLLSSGARTPPASSIKREVQDWVDSFTRKIDTHHEEKDFTFDGWCFNLEFYSSGAAKEYGRAIHLMAGHGGFSDTPSRLRSRLKLKSKRYGHFEKPLILVIGDTSGLAWGKDSISSFLVDALFGDEHVRIATDMHAQIGRTRNGFWLGRDGPRNTHVSAVLFFPDVGIWGLRNDLHKPLLAINPWADKLVPPPFELLTRMVIEDTQWKIMDGLDVADVVGLPKRWPLPKR